MQNLVNYFILYPYKSIVSVRFYFDVLFKMRGLGLVYMLIISTILAVFATFRFHAVVKIYDSINLPRLILEIPKSYLDENGVFSPLDGTTFYKEIYDDHGNLIILYNVKNENNGNVAIVELNSTSLKVKVDAAYNVLNYTDLVSSGVAFDPVSSASLVRQILDLALPLIFVFMLVWFLCILIFNTCLMALLSKPLFIFMGKIRTPFSNLLRLCAYANTSVGVVILVQLIFNINLAFNIIMFLPLIYMVFFVRTFRYELNARGVEGFLKSYGPKNIMADNAESQRSGDAKPDVSEYTQGLDSASNRQHQKDDKAEERKDSSHGDSQNGGSGFFVP
jgi:hypothetical protein